MQHFNAKEIRLFYSYANCIIFREKGHQQHKGYVVKILLKNKLFIMLNHLKNHSKSRVLSKNSIFKTKTMCFKIDYPKTLLLPQPGVTRT